MTKGTGIQNYINAHWVTFSLLAIVLGAAILRVVGINAGLPLALNGDEVALVQRSLALKWQDLNPHIFMYGSLPFYLAKGATLMASAVQQLVWRSSPSLSDYFLQVRLLSAICGVITIPVVYLSGKRIGDWPVGLSAAALIALSPLSVSLAHYATVDAMLGLWASLALLGMIMWQQDDRRGMYLAAIATGLAISTKYNAGILLVPLMIIAIWKHLAVPVVLNRSKFILFGILVLIGIVLLLIILLLSGSILSNISTWTTHGTLQPIYLEIFDRLILGFALAVLLAGVFFVGVLRRGVWANRIVNAIWSQDVLVCVLLCFGVFLVTSPFVIIDYQHSARDFFFQLNKNVSGGAASFDSNLRSYTTAISDQTNYDPLEYVRALIEEWGFVVSISIIVGFFVLRTIDFKIWLPLAILVLLTLGITLTWRYLALRYLYPLWGLFALLGGIGIVFLIRKIMGLLNQRWGRISIAVALTIVFLAPLTYKAFTQVQMEFLTLDTRNKAFDWLEKNSSHSDRILREWETPGVELAEPTWDVYPSDTIFEEASLAEWYNRGYNVALIGGSRLDFYQKHADAFPDVLAEYQKLKHDWRLAGIFEPGGGVKGPSIYIYLAP